MAIWTGNDGAYKTAANWNPEDVPDQNSELAEFANNGAATTVNITTDTNPGGFDFAADAPAFTINIAAKVAFGTGGLADGISNNSGLTQNIVVQAAGRLTFASAAEAGSDTTITVEDGGVLGFFGLATADDTSVVIAAGGTMEVQQNDGALTIGSLAGTGGEVAIAAGQTLTTGGANTSTAFGGLISGAGGLMKTGSGTFTLYGTSTYAGATIVSGGVLMANSVEAFSSASAFQVAAGAVLDIAGRAVTIGSLADFGGAGGTVTNADSIDELLTIGADGRSTSFSGTITDGDHAVALTKIGGGTQTLAGTNTYSGATTITSGTLRVDGSIVSATTVASGGTLGGSGTTAAVTVAAGGTLAPGASAGRLATGSVAMTTGAIFATEIGGAAAGAGGYDQLAVTGTVTLAGATLSGSLIGGLVPKPGSVFTIIANDGSDAVSGTFSGLAEGTFFQLDGRNFTISYAGGDDNDVVLTKEKAITIKGNSGNNRIDGSHTVGKQPYASDAEDVIVGAKGADRISGLGGDDLIRGGKGKDFLNGGADDDRIYGGIGKNVLTGGTGEDTFVFDAKLGKSKGSDPDTRFTFSKITDFEPGIDTIELHHSVFRALPAGALAADAFDFGKKATTKSEHILYDQATGALRYDKDGRGGADAVVFAKLTKGLDLTSDDFLIV